MDFCWKRGASSRPSCVPPSRNDACTRKIHSATEYLRDSFPSICFQRATSRKTKRPLLINHRTLQRVTCSSTAFTHVCVHYSIDGNMENIVFLNLPSILWTNPFESWEANRAYRWKSRFSRLCCTQFPVLRDQIDAIHEFRNSEFQFSALQDRYAVFYDGYKVGTELPWEERW